MRLLGSICSQGQLVYEASCYDVSLVFFDLVAAQHDCKGQSGNLVTINNELESIYAFPIYPY